MKIDLYKMHEFDIGVFKVVVPYVEASEWLTMPGVELEDVNGAIDEAASFASDHGRAWVLIEITNTDATAAA